MSKIRIISSEAIDKLIEARLKDDLDDLQGYFFEGDSANRANFLRILVFENDDIYKKAALDITTLERWINAYYWYSAYIQGLQKQHIPTSDHRQAQFKILEKIDHVAHEDFDWKVIEKIDNEHNMS